MVTQLAMLESEHYPVDEVGYILVPGSSSLGDVVHRKSSCTGESSERKKGCKCRKPHSD